MVTKKTSTELRDTKVPERYSMPHRVIMLAQTPVNDEMTYGEVKRILSAQKRLQTEFAKAALHHIKELTGRNLSNEHPQWKGHTIKVTGKVLTGKITVTQYQYDDKVPGREIGKWEFNKKILLNKYYKENNNG